MPRFVKQWRSIACAGWLPVWLTMLCGIAWAGIEDGPRRIEHPGWMSPVFVDLQADLERVRGEGKAGVLMLFTTQGCTYCAEFIAKMT